MAARRVRRLFNTVFSRGLRVLSRNNRGGLALIVAIGLLPAACAAEPQTAGSSGGVWIQFAANDSALDTPEDQSPPHIESPFGAYLAGIVAQQQRDLSVAADYMLQSLEADPESPELLSTAFNLVAGTGRQDVAVELARRLAAIEPDHAMANLILALENVHRGDIATAQSHLDKLPERGLGALLRPLLGGWMKVEQGEIDAGLEAIAGLAEVKGFELLYQLHRALMEDVSGRAQAAEAAYEEPLDAAGGITLRLAWISGNFFERAGRRDRAVEIYSDFLANSPGSNLALPLLRRAETGGAVKPEVADAKAGMAEVLFNLASLLSQERAESLALIHIQQALQLKPDFVVADVLLGEILEGQNRISEAIEVYRRIPEDSPFAWTVRLRIAEQLERLDETELALAELDTLANSSETQFEPLYRKGNLLRGHERFEEAIVAYDGALQRIGEPQQRHWSLLYFRGIALERSGQWDRAEKDFLKALELEPEQPLVMNYLAYSWVEKRQNLDQAKDMLLRAVELRPEDGFIVDSLGWVYYRLGEYENGVTYLEQAVELRPQDPVINDHLGDALWRVGRRVEARFQWRRALSLEPEEDQTPLIQEKLDSGMPDKPEDI